MNGDAVSSEASIDPHPRVKKYVLKSDGDEGGKPKKYAIDYEKELNAAQLKAALWKDGPALVIAGAGSGKTRTLTYRVARLVEDGVPPENILLLTFTRKAANEMLRRASALLDNRCEKVKGGTFHSFAHSVLRRYATLIGLQENFTILDRGDAEDIVNILRSRLGYGTREMRFPKKGTLASMVSMAVNKSRFLEEILEEEYPHFRHLLPDIVRIAEEYKRYKKARSLLDYDDLLVSFRQLLAEHEGVRKKVSNSCRYVMVDEYQDTNRLQADIVRLIADEHRNVMAVGDDAQSIYSFRGADHKNIMEFPNLFPETQIIKLEENYRSVQPILDLSNQILMNSDDKFFKQLYTAKKGGEKPAYIETQTENEQSKFIAQRVLELREEGVPLSQIAVLCRSGWHSNDLEVELRSRGIPFQKFGGFKFIETAHVKDLLAYVKVSRNPSDQGSFFRLLLLLDGVGKKTAEDALTELEQTGRLPLKNQEIFLLSTVLEEVKKAKSPADALEVALKHYRPLLEKHHDDFHKRQADLDSLLTISERYDDIDRFLADITLEPPEQSQSGVTGTKKDEEQPLTISTVHSAKGLEWHTVFLLSLVDGYFPSKYAVDDAEELEEERRLLYVAITRAKNGLYLLRPHLEFNRFDHSSFGFSALSRFLAQDDIIKEFTDQWVIANEPPPESEKQLTPKSIADHINEFFGR